MAERSETDLVDELSESKAVVFKKRSKNPLGLHTSGIGRGGSFVRSKFDRITFIRT